jgi:hypothetical protein
VFLLIAENVYGHRNQFTPKDCCTIRKTLRCLKASSKFVNTKTLQSSDIDVSYGENKKATKFGFLKIQPLDEDANAAAPKLGIQNPSRLHPVAIIILLGHQATDNGGLVCAFNEVAYNIVVCVCACIR